MNIKKHDFILRALSVGLKQGFILLSSFIAAKLLSLPQYGEFSYLMTVFAVALMVSDFGLSTAITRFVAQQADKSYAVRVLRQSLLLACGFLVVASIGVFVGIFFGLIVLTYSNAVLLLFAVGCALVTTVYEGVLRGLQEYQQSAIATTVATLLALPLLWFGALYGGIQGALGAIIFYWVMCVIVLVYTSRLGFGDVTSERQLFRQILAYAVQFGIAAMSYFLFSRYIVFVLGSNNEWESLAVYDLLSKVMLLFTFPLSIYGQVLAPVFAKEPYLSDKKLVKQQLSRYTLILTAVSVIVTLLFCIMAAFIPRILPDYGAYHGFWSLVGVSGALLFIFSWTNLIDTGILVPTGYASIMTMVYPIIGVVSIVLLPYLYQHGGVGALFWGVVALQTVMALSVRILFYRSLSR